WRKLSRHLPRPSFAQNRIFCKFVRIGEIPGQAGDEEGEGIPGQAGDEDGEGIPGQTGDDDEGEITN
ncbi:MAG: hypothetical protein J6X99_02335, partial [Bacteroidales bacterium]|nr:hypothetical protein [Bacteroidales bacterium]